MGNIRKIVAGSALALLCSSSVTAFAQSREQQTIDEVVRKAEAGENENGFCSRTGWPTGNNYDGFVAFLRAAAVGSWKMNTFNNGNCELNRVTKVHHESGAKCVSYSLWKCSKGGTCGTGAVVDCLDANNKLRRKE